MENQWKSTGIYEHPAKHQVGQFGTIELSKAGVYVLRQGGAYMSCPQDWAAKIHHDETNPENKRLRQVRDALNKCKNPDIVEQIGKLLNV